MSTKCKEIKQKYTVLQSCCIHLLNEVLSEIVLGTNNGKIVRYGV